MRQSLENSNDGHTSATRIVVLVCPDHCGGRCRGARDVERRPALYPSLESHSLPCTLGVTCGYKLQLVENQSEKLTQREP